MRLGEISPLFELFTTTPVALTKQNDRRVLGNFEAGGTQYAILFFLTRPPGFWTISFSPVGAKSFEDKYGDTGKIGVASIKVYALAIATCVQFLREYKPETLYFTGEKETGRDQLYTRLIDKVAPQIQAAGYTYKVDSEGGFTITRSAA